MTYIIRSGGQDDIYCRDISSYTAAREGTGTLGGLAGGTNSNVGQYLSTYIYVFQTLIEFNFTELSGGMLFGHKFRLDLDTDDSTTDFTLELYEYDYGVREITDFQAGSSFNVANRLAYLSTSGISLGWNDFTVTDAFKDLVNRKMIAGGILQFNLISSRQRTGSWSGGSERIILQGLRIEGNYTNVSMLGDNF